MQFSSYQTEGFYDEMFQADGAARPHYQLVQEIVQSLSDGQLLRYKHAAERLLLQLGITFNVYGDTAGTERIFPFDLIPRIVPAHEWERIEHGLKQRIHALNAFIGDIYHDQKILKDGAIPERPLARLPRQRHLPRLCQRQNGILHFHAGGVSRRPLRVGA